MIPNTQREVSRLAVVLVRGRGWASDMNLLLTQIALYPRHQSLVSILVISISDGLGYVNAHTSSKLEGEYIIQSSILCSTMHAYHH
jgi:hypothetical protein